ncbi:helix-turn-helix transcriptional regulator [Microbacterium sp. cf332]|uniref:helix-turn-helix transcriptional regulator n=1 Tax=Microbacterium sp. cf332 TaxID=1761804 RepID=UPI000889D0C6|nr:helix-turn-helix transcriptional regulator [Microbacterium sp. cf332]SDQ77631.1 regulatory protein, luxR family [Microbacterium sp. cf332]
MAHRGERDWLGASAGAGRDYAQLAERISGGMSVLVAGPRGSGRSYVIRALVAQLGRRDVPVVELHPSVLLSAVPYGALDAAADARLSSLRDPRMSERVAAVVVVDDVDALDEASAELIARAIAARRIVAVLGLRTARARARQLPPDAGRARRALLDLWAEGLVHRVELIEMTDGDARDLIEMFPGADLLDSPTRGGLTWRADGSRTLLRQLVLEAVRAARSDRDPLLAVRDVAPESRLALAVREHISDLPTADLECLAGLSRLPHLDLAAATRMFDLASVDALLSGGQVHADASPLRRLTVNDVLAVGALRRIAAARIDRIVDEAGRRMLAEAEHWWSPPIAASVAERWHRHGLGGSDELAHASTLRTRVLLDAAREANDRGDVAHASAHATHGAIIDDVPAFRLEIAIARGDELVPWLGSGDGDGDGDGSGNGNGRRAALDPVDARRLARQRADASSTRHPAPAAPSDDLRVETLLRDAAGASDVLDDRRAAVLAAAAAAVADASPLQRLRALTAAGAAEIKAGRLAAGREHHTAAGRLLDLRPAPVGITPRNRLEALIVLLAAHQIAGSVGSGVLARLRTELGVMAREGGSDDMLTATIAAAFGLNAEGRAVDSQRELPRLVSRAPAAPSRPSPSMPLLGIADELATVGHTAQARAIVDRIGQVDTPLLRRTVAYVETTVLVAEGRHDEARERAREAARLSTGATSVAFRIRDLYRLALLDRSRRDVVDELVRLAATTDLPVAGEAVRRISARDPAAPSPRPDELRLHALWGQDAEGSAERAPAARRHPSGRGSTADAEELTSREREVALLIDAGLTNREIATRLFLSVRTVESHIYQARGKLGAVSRRDLGGRVASSVELSGEML